MKQAIKKLKSIKIMQLKIVNNKTKKNNDDTKKQNFIQICKKKKKRKIIIVKHGKKNEIICILKQLTLDLKKKNDMYFKK